METKRKPFTTARILAVLIAPLLALGAVSGVFADQSPYDDEPKAVLEELAQFEDNNIVAVFNNNDEKFRTKASVDLDVVPGPDIVPVNVAWSQGTCLACKTMTVALQIALYEPGATNVSPENGGFALNIECDHCFTYARAHQIVLPVEDPATVAANAAAEVERLNGEVVQVLISAKHGEFTTDRAMTEVESLIDELKALAARIRNGEFDSGGFEEQAMRTPSSDRSATQNEATGTEAASPALPSAEDSAATETPSAMPSSTNDLATPTETPSPAPPGAEGQPAAEASPAPWGSPVTP